MILSYLTVRIHIPVGEDMTKHTIFRQSVIVDDTPYVIAGMPCQKCIKGCVPFHPNLDGEYKCNNCNQEHDKDGNIIKTRDPVKEGITLYAGGRYLGTAEKGARHFMSKRRKE